MSSIAPRNVVVAVVVSAVAVDDDVVVGVGVLLLVCS